MAQQALTQSQTNAPKPQRLISITQTVYRLRLVGSPGQVQLRSSELLVIKDQGLLVIGRDGSGIGNFPRHVRRQSSNVHSVLADQLSATNSFREM
jgi:hypothetical protein